MHLQYITKIIAQAAGWKEQGMSQKNEVCFEIEGDITLNIHCPGGDYVFLYGKLMHLPPQGQAMQEICSKVAGIALGTCKKMQSSVSICDNSIMIALNMSNITSEYVVKEKAKIFLNELVWWKKQLALLN